MKTKIATTFGLALMLGLGLFATMLALGTFSSAPQVNALGFITSEAGVVVVPTKAREIGEYTIQVTAAETVGVDGTFYVKFNTKTTVPSSISTSNVTLKADAVTGTGTADQVVNPSRITVSGKEVKLTVPDMDPSTAAASLGQQGIAAGKVTIVFSQAAGIQNPNLATAAATLQVWTSAETTKITSAVYTITSSLTNSSSLKARTDVITTSGVGMNASAATVKIYLIKTTTLALAEAIATDPTLATVEEVGSGSIDANGVFSGTWTVDSGTAGGGFIRIRDSAAAPVTYHATTRFEQKAGATGVGTENADGNIEAIPGGTVKVDLVDFTASAVMNTATSATIGGAAMTSTALTLPSTGNTLAATPHKFVVPTATLLGTHTITITDGTLSATFKLEVVTGQKDLTVTPATASIGQFVTVSGTGFTKSVAIAAGSLTGSGSAVLNTGTEISVDSAGNWSYTTRLDTIETSASRVSDAYTITAVQGTKTGKSTAAGFSRTPRTLTISPTTAAPGTNVTVSGTGMTVDTGEVTATAEVTISISGTIALSGTFKFPINTDGTYNGTISVPNNEVAGTFTITATDNASLLNVVAPARTNRTATATLKVPSGSVTVDPVSQTTGGTVTVTGADFPPSRTASILTIGGADAIPVSGVTTDINGTFSVEIEVPAQTNGGSLLPGVKIITVTIGQISGSTTSFAIPNPTFTIDPVTAAVEAQITVTGTGFNALTSVDVLTIGNADVKPSPAPRATSTGELEAFTIEIPALNPGTYTVVMQTGTAFSATATFTALAAPAATATPVAETVTEGTPTEVFSAAVESVPGLQVWSFDGATQTWAFFDATLAEEHPANDLAQVESGDGVWMFNDTDSNQSVDILGRSATLYPGWNLIGL